MKNIVLISFIWAALTLGCKKESDSDTKPVLKDSVQTPVDTTEDLIEISTGFGKMYMWLYKETPLHRANFLKLADSGFYNGTTFHRCVSNFVIQGGDPNSKDLDSTNDGTGGPGYQVTAEIGKPHIYGAVGAARNNNPAKASNGSQFYIVLPKSGTPNLNGNYTVFGLILKGMEAADSCVKQPQNASNRPYTNIPMQVQVVKKTRAQLRNEFQFFGYE